MKIAVDARALSGEPSGVGIYTRTLIAGLGRQQTNDEYLLLSNRAIEIDDPLPANIFRHERSYPIGNIWLQQRCPRLLKQERVDLFHGTNFLAPLLSPCPTVLTVHDLSSFLFPKLHTRRNNFIQRLLPACIRRAAAVIAISENTRRDLIEHLHVPAEKIQLIHNAPMPYFSEESTAASDIDLPLEYFLFVGTLEPRKNLTRLLAALARTKTQTPLLIVGADGWGGDEVRREYQRLGLGDRVRFLGYLAHHRLPAVMRRAQALLMPSIYEGFGLPVLEAMSCGTPVLAAANSSLAEVTGEAALLVDHRDVSG
nr:glycosyltransferase family 1 protein [bacterium]